jgi:TPR repeat protein
MYRDGRGGPRDVDRARSLLSVAATLGVDQARQLLRTINE